MLVLGERRDSEAQASLQSDHASHSDDTSGHGSVENKLSDYYCCLPDPTDCSEVNSKKKLCVAENLKDEQKGTYEQHIKECGCDTVNVCKGGILSDKTIGRVTCSHVPTKPKV